ncbi:hypothetical protein [Paucidesulfovibrio longus]|uniref:hypothetical protein n=1 Tax=Paucidesulfovibrio longus TaxID=889 RepID=UPI0012DBCF87|nr:hypothetical protein [Paucidesulfovibrio longus]
MFQINSGFRLNWYDFFGLLAPGILFSILALICTIQIKYRIGLIESFTKVGLATSELEAPMTLVVIFVAVIVAYIIGHIIASLATLFIERIFLGKILQHPINVIVFYQNPQRDLSSTYYRAVVVIIYMCLFCYLVEVRIPDNSLYILDIFSGAPLCCFLGSLYFIVIILKMFGDLLQGRSTRRLKKYHKNVYFILQILGAPFFTSEKMVIQFLGLAQAFPYDVQSALRNKYKKVFGRRINEALLTEAFWSVYWHITSVNLYVRTNIEKLQNLYLLMRNMSFVALCSSVLLVLPEKFGGCSSDFMRNLAVFMFLLSFVFVIQFYYYFWQFSITVFRTFIYLDCEGGVQTQR